MPRSNLPPGTVNRDFQGFQCATSQTGILIDWLDEKGYGWVKSGEKRYFAHIKDFESGQRRPRKGEKIGFIQGTDEKGRLCAKNIRFVRVGGRIGTWMLLAVLLALPLLSLLWVPMPWWIGASAMLVMSAITYGMYGHDKRLANSGGWRTAEKSLHLAELLGGWPGALLAQRRFRHKCSKGSYQFVFWCIIILHQIVAVDLILRHRLSRAAMEFFKQ
jgi:uncharacterized membrane protein YsdA (DUF1294 family)/cold shock CspA family protein